MPSTSCDYLKRFFDICYICQSNMKQSLWQCVGKGSFGCIMNFHFLSSLIQDEFRFYTSSLLIYIYGILHEGSGELDLTEHVLLHARKPVDNRPCNICVNQGNFQTNEKAYMLSIIYENILLWYNLISTRYTYVCEIMDLIIWL